MSIAPPGMLQTDFREARAEDADALTGLALEASWHHFRLAPEIFSEPTSASAPSFDLVETRGISYLHVAAQADRVVGFVSAESILESRAFLRPARFARINLVAVSETSRELGIGRQLVARAERWAKSVGCTQVRLNVWTVNDRAGRFYETLGYHVVATTMGKSIGNEDV